MAKFIKFTNASLFHEGNPITINIDHITSIFRNNVEGEDKKAETILYSAHSGMTWEIKETYDEVMEIITNENRIQHRRSKKLY